MTVLIPDVSEFQTGATAPDWAGIKTKNGGAAIIRVGYGDAHLDHMFVSNYTALKNNKYKFIGLYQYLVAGQDPVAQAKQFCTWIGPKTAIFPGTVFILDLEEGNGDQQSRAMSWHNTVDTFYGLTAQPLNMRSWLYSYTSFVQTHNLAAVFASNRRTWIAAYQASPPLIGHTLWQSTDGTTGANITAWPGAGRCDTSIFQGDLTTLASMGWQGTVTPPDPPPFHGEWVSAGMQSLSALAAQFKVATSSLLRMTAVHYGFYDPLLAGYINDVHAGKIPPTANLPKGAKVWVN